jgi:hypothetical protein
LTLAVLTLRCFVIRMSGLKVRIEALLLREGGKFL